MTKPNEMTKEILANVAKELENLACAAESEADLWRQAAENFRRYDVAAADVFRMQAITAHRNRSTGHQDMLMAIRAVDPNYFGELAEELAINEIQHLSVKEVILATVLHEATCTNRTCRVHAAFRARLGRD